MKNFVMILTLGIFMFLSFGSMNASAGMCDILNNCEETKINYCKDDECGLVEGTEQVKEKIDAINTTDKASEYVQKIVVYLLTFVTIIAILYIIYAGFKVLTGAGDEEAQSSAKSTIISVFAGIALIWLSYTIVGFMMSIINN